MKYLIYVAIVIALALSTSANAQVISKTIDLADTTASTKADRYLADKWLGKVGGIKSYGSDIEGEFNKDSTVTIWQLENVDSRDKAGASTQFLIMYVDKVTKKPNARITSDYPTNTLDAAIASGCGCFSVKQGDDDGTPIDPSLLE